MGLCYNSQMTAISQLQLSYHREEDRILFRLNTSGNDEFRFWITRRFSILLIKALLAHRATDPDLSTQPTDAAKQAVQSFKREEANSQGNFKDDFKQQENFPLGDTPVLAQKLSYRIEGAKLHLAIDPKSGKGINIVLDPKLNFNVSKLLKSASESAKWGLAWDVQQDDSPETRVVN